MAREFWQEEVPGGSMPLDLTVDPVNAGFPQYPADWVEMTGGGTLTYLDGSGQTQTLTSTAPGYVVRSATGFRKLVSLSGASPNLVRCGTGEGPSINYDAGAASSASAAAGSATAAASSATAAATSATTAAAAGPKEATFTVDYTDWASLGSAVTNDYTVTLPSNARLMGSAILESWIGADDSTHAAITVEIGITAGGATIGAATDIQTSTGGPFPQNVAGTGNVLGLAASGVTLTLRVTATVAHLATFTAGHVVAKIPYFVAA